ncbi:MAG: response regulator transcription factor [Hyphomicrobiaceae bacterium]|nr:response regulator transcription factor [Hyphomicrobiaceae bacterium]
MNGSTQIFVVDDDPAVRDALSTVFELEGYAVSVAENGEGLRQLIGEFGPAPVLLDVHMPGQSGLEVLKTIDADSYPAPIFMISGQGDIPMAVTAMKTGAFDFIEKPFDMDTAVARVRQGIEDFDRRNRTDGEEAAEEILSVLTPREREVLEQITSGASNKEAGRTLGISPRTIEVHRARIMEKLGAKNAADLVRIVLSGHA